MIVILKTEGGNNIMISLYPVIAKQLALPLGKEFKLKPKRGGAYPAQYRFSADDLEYLRASAAIGQASVISPCRCVFFWLCYVEVWR